MNTGMHDVRNGHFHAHATVTTMTKLNFLIKRWEILQTHMIVIDQCFTVYASADAPVVHGDSSQ